MLVFGRTKDERVMIGENVTLTVVEVRPNGVVRLGFDAPLAVEIDREEVRAAKERERQANGHAAPACCPMCGRASA